LIGRHRRGIDAYGVATDAGGRVLLVGDPPGLPGGPVPHGEHPADTVAEAFRTQTGTAVRVVALRDVVADVDARWHRDRLVFTVEPLGQPSRGAWLAPVDPAALTASAGLMLGLVMPDNDRRATGAKVHWPHGRVQRFAAYGFATDPSGNVLLTLISDRYPGAGRWHLPGGGTDFGESPAVGLAREIVEETGQHGVIAQLMGVSHRYQRDARGPEGRPVDWHGVRVVYRVHVEEPTEPRVLDHGGSTAAAGWFTPAEALALSMTEVAHEALSQHLAGDR
jgi:ADP-ribose pyrophosphatase YjhB (NUDIX family)